MKTLMFKRVAALVIDLLFVSMISMLIVSLPIFKNEKAEMLSEELVSLTSEYLSGNVTREDYNDKSMDLSYRINKNSIKTNIISIVIIMSYFTCFDYFLDGRTIGKKIFKIKLKSYNGEKNNILRYFTRELITSHTYITIIDILLILIMKKSAYINSYNTINNLLMVSYLGCYIFVMFREDGRGPHDFIANTIVIDERKSKDEIEVEEKVEKIKNKRKRKESEDR